MQILDSLKQLRDDIKTWVTNNLNALNAKIDEKTIPIDSELNSVSTNPVQNKAIATEIADINNRVGDTPVATQISDAIAKQPHFSGDYNDLTNAPDIYEDGSGNMVITDESGNIIFSADADGIHTTAVTINGEKAASEKFVEEAIAAIDIPETDFTGYAKESYVDEAIANIEFPKTDFTGYATETYVDNKIADLVNSAPEALNTLGELATALETHEDAYDALLETVDSKATQTDLENLKEELSESIVSETDEWKIVDEAGNIIFSVDAEGAHTTTLILDGKKAATEEYVNETVAGIDIPEVDFTGYATEDYVDTAIQEALVGKEVDLSNYYTKQETEALIPDTSSFLTAVPADYVTESELNDKGFLTEHQSLEGLATTSELEAHNSNANIHVTIAEKQQWNAKSNFSGDYNDLTNAPAIAEDETGDLVIADNAGNIIFRASDQGLETTHLSIGSLTINGMTIQEMIKAYVDEAILGGEW